MLRLLLWQLPPVCGLVRIDMVAVRACLLCAMFVCVCVCVSCVCVYALTGLDAADNKENVCVCVCVRPSVLY
jgi:hypothetical protein